MKRATMEGRIFLFLLVAWLVRASRGGASRLQNEQLFKNNPWEEYWIEKLPNTPRPKELTILGSHLSILETRTLMQNLQVIPGDSGFPGNPGSDDGSFCRNYGFLCEGDARGPLVCVGPYWYNYGANRKCDSRTLTSTGLPSSTPQQISPSNSSSERHPHEFKNSGTNATSNIFFRYVNFTKGAKILYPKLDNNLQGRTFLPSDLAKIMPLGSNQLEKYLKVLRVPYGSNMATSMEDTLSFCNSSNEDAHTCHASIESMVDFVVKEMGSNVVTMIPSFNTNESSEVYFLEVPIALSPTNETSIACHDLMFPYLVYGCHVIHNSIVYDAVLQKEGVPSFHAPFVCHMDTSSWDPSHVAFLKLDAHPGDGPICHWIPQNTFIWVKT